MHTYAFFKNSFMFNRLSVSLTSMNHTDMIQYFPSYAVYVSTCAAPVTVLSSLHTEFAQVNECFGSGPHECVTDAHCCHTWTCLLVGSELGISCLLVGIGIPTDSLILGIGIPTSCLNLGVGISKAVPLRVQFVAVERWEMLGAL